MAFARCSSGGLTANLVRDGESLVRLSLGRSSYKCRRTATTNRLRKIAWEAMMVNSYDGIYQAERGKTAAGIRMTAGPSPLTTVPQPRENGERKVMASMQWRDATVGGQDTTGLSLDLPCTEDPELFFAESPQDVEQAKAMCRGCRARGPRSRRGTAERRHQ